MGQAQEWTVASRVRVKAETPDEALELVRGNHLPCTEYEVENTMSTRARGQGLVLGLMPLIPLWSLLEAAGFPNVPRILLGLT